MTPSEAVVLTRYVKACCPQQQIDEYTADAWHDLLGDLAIGDCREAVKNVASRQPFVAPAEIRAEVKRIRADRLEGFQYVPTQGADYLTDLRAQIAAVADGRRDAAPALPAGPRRDYDPETAFAEILPRPPKDDRPLALAERQHAETPEEEHRRKGAEAFGYLLAIDSEAARAAMAKAREQLGPDAETDDVAILAATLTAARPGPARPDKATAERVAADGCPNGCPLGTHVKPCHFTEAS